MKPAWGVAVTALAAAAALLQPAPASAAACSEADIRVMKKEGLSRSAIDRICTSAPAKSSAGIGSGTKSGSNRCQTIVTTCFIAQAAPAGTACWCASPSGPVTGKVQP
jgi:hypothetical protein